MKRGSRSICNYLYQNSRNSFVLVVFVELINKYIRSNNHVLSSRVVYCRYQLHLLDYQLHLLDYLSCINSRVSFRNTKYNDRWNVSTLF